MGTEFLSMVANDIEIHPDKLEPFTNIKTRDTHHKNNGCPLKQKVTQLEVRT